MSHFFVPSRCLFLSFRMVFLSLSLFPLSLLWIISKLCIISQNYLFLYLSLLLYLSLFLSPKVTLLLHLMQIYGILASANLSPNDFPILYKQFSACFPIKGKGTRRFSLLRFLDTPVSL